MLESCVFTFTANYIRYIYNHRCLYYLTDMGAGASKYLTGRSYSESVRNFISRKRKYSEDDDSDGEQAVDFEKSQCQKRKKMKKTLLSTPQYIYQTLFKEGTDSDITVYALGKDWKLHKVYLCQSPYFASMFSGAWKETNENEVYIEIVDPKITVESLYIVLGSLYWNELTLESSEVVSVLATAALFQLDSVAERCAEVMNETLNIETVLQFYLAAEEYGMASVKEGAFKWLLANLLTCVKDLPEVLSSISIDLMVKLVKSPNLFVVQTESSLYYLLQIWLYYILNPQHSCVGKQQIIDQSSKFFQNQPGTIEFLKTEEGKKYEGPFKALRYQHIINLYEDVKRLRCDRIVPLEWIDAAVSTAWLSFQRFDQGFDRGPKECSVEELSCKGLRCGRSLMDDGDHVWRWTGFLYGLDLVWTCNNKSIKVRRNHRSNDVACMLSMASRRYIICRVTIAKLDSQRQIKSIESSNILNLSFIKHEEVTVMTMKSDLEFPVYLLAEILLTNYDGN